MQIKKMTWNKTKLSVLCEEWEAIELWLSKLDMGYQGANLAGATFEALQCLIKRKNVRVPLTGEEKAAILEQYNHKCAFCSSKTKYIEVVLDS